MTTDTTSPTNTGPATINGTGDDPAAAGPNEPTPSRPLADFLPGGPFGDQVAVTLPSGDPVVVLGRAVDGQVEVWSLGHITRRTADTVASAVSDPARRDGLLADALRGLGVQRQVASAQAARAMADRDQERDSHEQVLDAIRAYAVGKHQNGDICRHGLEEFLRAFGLPEYQPRIRVHYTLTGTYDVEGEDIEAVRRDTRSYLCPDLSDVDEVVEDSDTHTVHVDSVEELHT